MIRRGIGPSQSERQSALFQMAHRSTTVSDTFTGVNGAGWDATKWKATATSTTPTVDIQSNAARIQMTTGNYSWVYKDVNLGASRHFLMTCKLTPPAGEWYLVLNTRVSARSPNLHELEAGYYLEISGSGIRISRFTNNAKEVLADVAKFAVGLTRVKASTIGQVSTLKIWPDAESEPVNDDIVVVDPTPPKQPGTCGVQLYGGAAVTTYTAILDDFVVRTA